MKKILFLLATMCVVSSCAPIVKTCVGDVTAYNADGSVLKKWEGVELSSSSSSSFGRQESSAMKTFGVNFYDNDSKKFIVVGNAVPCIIEYNVYQNQSNENNQLSEEDRTDLEKEYRSLTQQISQIKKELREVERNSPRYEELNNQMEIARIRKQNINDVYYRSFGRFISSW